MSNEGLPCSKSLSAFRSTELSVLRIVSDILRCDEKRRNRRYQTWTSEVTELEAGKNWLEWGGPYDAVFATKVLLAVLTCNKQPAV
jgi:hypothetical protein